MGVLPIAATLVYLAIKPAPDRVKRVKPPGVFDIDAGIVVPEKQP